VKCFLILTLKCVQSQPSEVLPSTAFLDQKSVSSYLDPISLDSTNHISGSYSSYYNTYNTNKTAAPTYNSPYYNPLLNRRQESAPLTSAEYPDYQFSSGSTGYGAPVAPVITDTSGYGSPLAPAITDPLLYSSITDPPPDYYDSPYEETGSGLEEVTEEESLPEISQSILLLMLGVVILFLWPVTVTVPSDPLVPRATIIPDTTIMPREFDNESSFNHNEECENENVFLCIIGKYAFTLGRRFLPDLL